MCLEGKKGKEKRQTEGEIPSNTIHTKGRKVKKNEDRQQKSTKYFGDKSRGLLGDNKRDENS